MEQSPEVVPPRELRRYYPVTSFTDVEKLFYNETVLKSGGFVCGYIVPGICHPCHLMPIVLESIHSIKRKKMLNDLGQRAINFFNIKKESRYCFQELSRVNSREVKVMTKVVNKGFEATVYYITFKANEEPGTPLRNFKAIVLCYLDDKSVQYCEFAESLETIPPVANVLFLDSPAGVGYSYSNTSSDYTTVGDKRTAEDSYTFLLNWLERFPQYKNRDFYVTGESYAGHFVPQLAYTILSNNKTSNQAGINLKGITIGNGWLDDITGTKGIYDYFWTHALNSDETHAGITKYCDYVTGNFTGKCLEFQRHAHKEIRKLDIYNIYAPLCHSSALKSPPSPGSVKDFDPCTIDYVRSYMNLAEVQKAFHAKNTTWLDCNTVEKSIWADSPLTVLPIIKQLIASGMRLWLFSGDIDGRFPVTSTRYSINSLELPVETEWRPWFSADEVGGYVVGYKGLVLVTVRGAGHQVPSYQPERALAMFSHFLEGTLPPSS